MTKFSCVVSVLILTLTTLNSEVAAVKKRVYYGDRVACNLPIQPRGGGTLPKCPMGEELELRLCYPNCKPGYHGRGPICFPEDISYSRGTGHLPGNGGCEEGTELEVISCYSKCKLGYHGVGPLCWTDLKPYGRTVGTVPTYCGEKEYDTGLCYDKCPKSYKVSFNTCNMQECPKYLPYNCGTYCTDNKARCEWMTRELSLFFDSVEDCDYTE